MSFYPAASLNAAIEAIYVPTDTYYATLHTTSPGTTGANEVSGGSYVEQAITFGSPTGGVEASTNAQSFDSLPAALIGYFGTRATLNGTWMGGGTLSAELEVPEGATVAAAIGSFQVSAAG